MSEKFSPTLRIGDLSHFIAPSQACVVSLKATPKKPEPQVLAAKSQQTERVKISLKDCLACSGYITSAETVMLEMQSLDEFLSNINKGKAVIVSLSPQSRASLSAHFGIPPLKRGLNLEVFSPHRGSIRFDTEVDFKALEVLPLDRPLTIFDEQGHLYGVSGSSGGYTETVFRYAAKVLFGREIDGPLDFRTIRNSDFRELSLEVEGKTVLKFALCYGFQNLQNIVRKVKTRKCNYQYMEVMACPSGCLNGGGQIKPKPGQSLKKLIKSLETVYMENVLEADPFKNPLVKRLYDEWLEHLGSEKAKRHMHTGYHPVVKSITAQLHNW